jgi:hypothetical protein
MFRKPQSRCSSLAGAVVALGMALTAAAPGLAAWTPDGVPVAMVGGDQVRPVVVSDGVGGAIIAWWDDRAGSLGIYAQRIDADGNPMWTPNGIQVGLVEWYTVMPVAVSDGLGGAYVIWSDARDAGHSEDHLYAQRIGADGAPHWTAGGIKVCPAGGRQYYPVAISDYRPQVGINTNGFIVVFEDTRTGTFTLFAQRMDMNGARLWGNGGVALSSSESSGYAAVATDGTASPFFSAGAIVAWETSSSNIRANRVDAGGVVQWGGDGLPICSASGDQTNPALATIGPRRAIIAWEDYRDPDDISIFAQMADNGTVPWTLQGVPVTGAPGPQYQPQLAPAQNGVYLAWADGRDLDEPLNHDIYAQRLDLNGANQWGQDAIPVCDRPGFQSGPLITPDGFGGFCVVWVDGRGDDDDLRAQRMSPDGNPLWDPEGVVVSGALGNQYAPELFLQGDAILLAWEDTRNGSTSDVYAGRFAAGGTAALPEVGPGVPPASGFLVQLISASPLSGEARFAVELSAAGQVGAEVSDASGRRVWKLQEDALVPGRHVFRWDGRDASGRPVPSGVYFMRVAAGSRSHVVKLVQAP